MLTGKKKVDRVDELIRLIKEEVEGVKDENSEEYYTVANPFTFAVSRFTIRGIHEQK
ncbi:hypothetical protein Niako_0319 [Niastella koreensis GR20-10]|uniref:Uncharacterized protein n=1 Tax=Niastella koreensis (strain DSM 17620 / KACC 11465 / NBRC 106392 / GR20-10) TaxID=700598 RepID=G8TPB1_NIAKG|nr:hypothetical protein Niako_0319 [Niastella koreensis GR20-10]